MKRTLALLMAVLMIAALLPLSAAAANGEKLIALFNFGDLTKTVWTDQTEDFTDLLTGECRKAQGVALAPGGFVWLACDFDKREE